MVAGKLLLSVMLVSSSLLARAQDVQNVSYSIEELRQELKSQIKNQDLSSAQKEAITIARRIRTQISTAYAAALKEGKTPEAAVEEIKKVIESDLASIGSDYAQEIREISLDALNEVQIGNISHEVELKNLQKIIEQKSKTNRGRDIGEVGANLSSEKTEYDSVDQLLESLTSSGESSRWVSTGNYSFNDARVVRADKKASFQVKAEYLGVALEAGPSLLFSDAYGVRATFYADGLKPVILADGNFDFYQRDRSNKIIEINGVKVKRHVAFVCEADVVSMVDLAAGGTLTFMGMGGTLAITESDVSVQTLASRRIQVPEYIDGKSVTVATIRNICHNKFLSAKVSDSLTVEESLKIMMDNFKSNLRYSHSSIKCAIDAHCINWFNHEIIPGLRHLNYPRCVPENREGYTACQLRGLKKQNCAVFDENGKKVSSGWFEYTCDQGLKCVTIQKATWKKHAVGRCMPINANTYSAPGKKKLPPNVIEVEIISANK